MFHKSIGFTFILPLILSSFALHKPIPPARDYVSSDNSAIKNFGIILPGYSVPSEDYLSLSNTIKQTATLKNIHTDIIIANVTSPTKQSYEQAIDSILDYIDNTTNYDDEINIFMIAHSAAKSFAIEKSIKNSSMFIILGSVLDSKNILSRKYDTGSDANNTDDNSTSFIYSGPVSLSSYPKPILTLLGQSDGIVDYNYAKYEFHDIQHIIDHNGYDYVAKYKPIVIIPGLNHMLMADGKLTDIAIQIGMKDNDTDMQLYQAHQKIANVIIHFLKANLFNDAYSNHELKKMVIQSHHLFVCK